MTYERPRYGDPSVPMTRADNWFGSMESTVPKFPAPVTAAENFRLLAARNNPYWLTNSSSDFQTLMTQDIVYSKPGGVQLHANFKDPRNFTEDYTFDEWFGGNWTWVVSAGGAMLTPGRPNVCDDITKWETQIKFPNLDEWGFETRAADYLRDTYDPEKVMHFDAGRGVTERLVSLMGGYTDAMTAMAEEPEAVRDFFERYADFLIEFFDRIHGLYKLNLFTLHDDWGTERDTFFSERMMEDLVFAPTKRVIDHVHNAGCVFELHTCGAVTRFMPYMIDMGADILQLQARANDMRALKEKYGDKIGFNMSPETGFGLPPEEQNQKIREFVDFYGKHGGVYGSVMAMGPEAQWEMMAELFYYSREFYDKAAGR